MAGWRGLPRGGSREANGSVTCPDMSFIGAGATCGAWSNRPGAEPHDHEPGAEERMCVRAVEGKPTRVAGVPDRSARRAGARRRQLRRGGSNGDSAARSAADSVAALLAIPAHEDERVVHGDTRHPLRGRSERLSAYRCRQVGDIIDREQRVRRGVSQWRDICERVVRREAK